MSNLIVVKDLNFSEILVNINIIKIKIYGNQNGDIFTRDLPFLNLIRALSVSP